MHGVLVGAILGMAVVAFIGARRTVLNWRQSKTRPAKWVLALQVGLQGLLGVVCVVVGLWYFWFGG